ncbi:MAG TPA: c-type cytochrome [Thermoanaerobaculia bacterium]
MKRPIVFVSTALLLALAGNTFIACKDLFPHRSEGEKLYLDKCADCHGQDGRGNTVQYMGNQYADLRDDNWKNGSDDASIANVIREGVFGQMPKTEGLTDHQIRAIVTHLRVLRGEKHEELAP